MGGVRIMALSTLLAGAIAVPQLAKAAPYDGVTLHMASMNDQFSGPLVKLAADAKKDLGIDLEVDILSYPELLTKITADFVGHTKGYDLVTMDIVWAGQFEEAGYTLPLGDLIQRDKAELKLDDIYPILMMFVGQYDGKQIAYPFAGYANVLAYRKDLYDAAGLEPPKTMNELIVDAKTLTDKKKHVYGWVANGQRGPAVAQDWMQYNAQLGGSILGPDGKPAINSAANIESLVVYKKLFDETAPPGAVEFDWGGREESFRQGLVANMQTWSGGCRRLQRSLHVEGGGQGRHHAGAGEGGHEADLRRRRLGHRHQCGHRQAPAGRRLGLHQVDHEPGDTEEVRHDGCQQLYSQEHT